MIEIMVGIFGFLALGFIIYILRENSLAGR
jgi:hypothetical protein